MTSKLLAVCVMFLAVGLLVATVIPAGCESGDSCAKDTDCELPLVCVRSACVQVGQPPDVSPVEDGGIEVDDDAPPVEGDGDEGGGTDADDGFEGTDDGPGPDADGDADADGGCMAVTSPALSLNPATGAADGDERVAMLASGSGFVWLGRAPGATLDGLLLARFRLDGSLVGTPSWPLSGVEIGPAHPLVELPDGKLAIAFAVPSAVAVGIWIKIVPASGTTVSPRQVDGTDGTCSSPTITYDGTSIVILWADDDGAGNVQLMGGHFSPDTGLGLDTPTVLATGPTGTREPRIVWSTIRHALVYIDGTDGALHVRSFDGAFTQISESIVAPPSGHTILGYPALAWNGSVYGLLWETRGTSSSTMHFATFAPDETPVERDPMSTVSLSSAETGQVALAWADDDSEWGIAWRHARAGRVGISLVRFDADTSEIKEGPVDVRPESTTPWHPSVAYNNGYYGFGWIAPAAPIHPMSAPRLP